jgi:hypothetical protein
MRHTIAIVDTTDILTLGDEVIIKVSEPSMDFDEFNTAGSIFVSSWEPNPIRSQASSARSGRHASPPLYKLGQAEPSPRPTVDVPPTRNGSPGTKTSRLPANGEVGKTSMAKVSSNDYVTRPSTPQRAPNSTSQAYHTPKTMRTPKGTEWTVDKIASELSKCARDVQRDHGRLVKFRLEEVAQKAREPRHVSEVDFFANMPPAAMPADDGKPLSENVVTVKFKVSGASRYGVCLLHQLM